MHQFPPGYQLVFWPWLCHSDGSSDRPFHLGRLFKCKEIFTCDVLLLNFFLLLMAMVLLIIQPKQFLPSLGVYRSDSLRAVIIPLPSPLLTRCLVIKAFPHALIYPANKVYQASYCVCVCTFAGLSPCCQPAHIPYVVGDSQCPWNYFTAVSL